MKLRYLGTAAAEGFPGLFCRCPTCTRARAMGGKNIRGRSGAVLDDTLLIDFPPDINLHALNGRVDLGRIADIVVTHSHSDHFCPVELTFAGPEYYAYDRPAGQVINLYGNGNVGRGWQHAMMDEFRAPKDFVRYTRLRAYQPAEIQGFTITPLPALHALADPSEDPFFYMLQKQGKSVLYANDTGIFYDEVFDFLKSSKVVFDLVSFDCTFGPISEGGNHMGMPDNAVVRDRLRGQGNANDDTRYVVTHFSHNCKATHDQLEAAAAQYGFIVAYDGMEMHI